MGRISPGKLFELRLEHSKISRQRAVESIRELVGGGVQATIGGRIRGKTIHFPTRKAALAAITEHYNRELFQKIRDDTTRQSRVRAAVDEVTHDLET